MGPTPLSLMFVTPFDFSCQGRLYVFARNASEIILRGAFVSGLSLVLPEPPSSALRLLESKKRSPEEIFRRLQGRIRLLGTSNIDALYSRNYFGFLSRHFSCGPVFLALTSLIEKIISGLSPGRTFSTRKITRTDFCYTWE